MFDVTLKDSSGEIKATGFNDGAVHFHTLFEEGKVYMVSTATIKPANKNFNATDHNYELSFHKGTTVTLCQEASSQDVPRLQHNFKTVNDINDGCQDKDTVDFVGIVADVADVVHFTARSGKELTKREVTIFTQLTYQVLPGHQFFCVLLKAFKCSFTRFVGCIFSGTRG